MPTIFRLFPTTSFPRHGAPPFSGKNARRFVAGQFGYMSPLLLGGLLYAVYRSFREGYGGRDPRYLFLFWTSAPTLVFFYLVSLWTKEAEPHWPALRYFTAVIAAAALIDSTLPGMNERERKRFQRFASSAAGLALGMIVFFYVQIFYPIWRPEVQKYDITNELWGWDKAGERVEELYGAISKEGLAFVFSRKSLLSSQISFATGGKIPVYKINNTRDQFDFWQDQVSLQGKNAIYVADNRFTKPPEKRYRCDRIVREPDLLIFRGGSDRWSRKFFFYRCYGYQGKK